MISIGGARINDMYAKVNQLLKKKPKTIILHVGTNDTISKPSHTISDELLKPKHHIEAELLKPKHHIEAELLKPKHHIEAELLKPKHHIEAELSGVNVILSCANTRTDNGIGTITIKRLIDKINILKCNSLSNTNIGETCLGRKGLHLNPKGGGGGALCNESDISDTEALALIHMGSKLGKRQTYRHILYHLKLM